MGVARVISYIDGFNLYYGLKAKRMERFLWLDVQALSANLCVDDQTLVETGNANHSRATAGYGTLPETARIARVCFISAVLAHEP